MRKRGGIGITIRGYEKKGKLVVQVGNVAAIIGEIKRKKKTEKKSLTPSAKEGTWSSSSSRRKVTRQRT